MIVTLTLRACLSVPLTRGDQDGVETVDFGNVKEVFKLDTGAQCNVLPKTSV